MTGVPDRFCRHCKERLRAKMPASARYCSSTCRSAASEQRQSQAGVLPAFARGIEAEFRRYAPLNATEYGLIAQGRLYPNPMRRVLRFDGAMRKSRGFRIRPFEVPAVPTVSLYQVVLFDAEGTRLALPPGLANGIWVEQATATLTPNDGYLLF